jgi:hypothetical protein
MGGSHYEAPPPPDYTPMLEEIKTQREQMNQAQKTSDEANRKAMIQAQDNAAQQGMTQANFDAQQALGRQQAYQQAVDAASTAAAKAAMGTAGKAQTGGLIDVSGAAAQKLANLGASVGQLPSTAANLAASAAKPAAQVNQFTLPNTSGVTFGGY